VAISTVRSVLDPGRQAGAGHYVATDREAVWLSSAADRVDVYRFLDDAQAGLAAAGSDGEAATAQLRAAEAAYRGEYLVEDAYEDWAAALREEARQTYIRVAHELARLATAQGDPAAAATFLRRIIEQDEYDEAAHLALVLALATSGRPADARRAYGTYLGRMGELGVEAAPFPA
jgi:DNA-binding SARP family transcriptional activator